MLNSQTNETNTTSQSSDTIKIGYDTRICKEYGYLPAACLFNKAQALYSHGEFGITDQDFSKLLGMTLITFRRAKKSLRNRLGMRIGDGNKTYYSIKECLPYDPESYRSFDLNLCYIMGNNLKGGAFLGQLIYWAEKELKSKNPKFQISKTNNQIINDLPFLSKNILPSLKDFATEKGFIAIESKEIGTRWGVSHYKINYAKIQDAINKLNKNEDYESMLDDLISQQILVWIKTPRDIKLSVCQNPESLNLNQISDDLDQKSLNPNHIDSDLNQSPSITNSFDTSILSSADDQKTIPNPVSHELLEERKKLTKDMVEQPLNTSNPPTNAKEEEKMEEKKEIYQMIGIWKETVSKTETIDLSHRLKADIEEAFTQRFDSSIDKWKAYCTQVAENEWLMGKNDKGWKAQLCWAVKLENIDKVLSGSIYGKKKPENYKTDQIPITVEKQELIDEVFASNESIQIKKIKVTLIDKMDKAKGVGLMSYHTYFRRAAFDISEVNGKKKLSIKSTYGAFNGLLRYHEMIAMACHEFGEVVMYGGSNDRNGNQIYMQRIQEKDIKPCELWEKLCLEKDLGSFPEKTPDLLMGKVYA